MTHRERGIAPLRNQQRATDANAIAISGRAEHQILEPTGRDCDRIDGAALQLSREELALADAYEDKAYRRVRVRLISGTVAWVYVRA